MNAIILAAGFGQRMRPVTEILPKPLLPIAGVPVIRKAIQNIVRFGVKDIVINLHHLPTPIKHELTNISGVTITFSEEPEILGTAGGIRTAMEIMGAGEYIVVNSDILLEVDLAEVLLFHRKKKALCTMIVREDKDTQKYGALGIDKRGIIQSFPGNTHPVSDLSWYMYTGVQIMHSDFLAQVQPYKYCDISKEIYPDYAVKGDGLYGFVCNEYWKDIGVPARYLEANKRFLSQNAAENELRRGYDPCFIGKNTEIHPKSQIGPFSSIDDGCTIAQGVTIKNSVIMKNSVIGSNSLIKNSIIGPSTQIPNDTVVEGVIAASVRGATIYNSY